ncbi:MAG: TrmH family RNA methyltransferase [Candidatus Glassbacteria bacterium]|nr:TrmH family RNA methyltransferase [Candidatus Glassbacteria bacterium]
MPEEKNIRVRDRDRSIPIEVYSRLPRHPVTVVLDSLRSRFNVGAIFRSCECARVEKIFTCGITAHPPDEKLAKTAMGTCEFVPHEHVARISEVISGLRESGIPLVALETTRQSRSIYEVEFPRPVCLAVGNEALGLSREVLEAAGMIVEIPLHGYKNSLNVAAATGIALFEILRQWGAGTPEVRDY